MEKYERMDYIVQGVFLTTVPTGEYYNAVTLNLGSFEHEKNAALTMKVIPIPETTVDKSNGINTVCRRCPPHHTTVCFRRPP